MFWVVTNSRYDPGRTPASAGRYVDLDPQAATHPAAIDGGQGLKLVRNVGGISGTVGFIDRVLNSFESQGWNWLDTHGPNTAGVLARNHRDIEVQYKAPAKECHAAGSGGTGQALATRTHACEVRRNDTVSDSKGSRSCAQPIPPAQSAAPFARRRHARPVSVISQFWKRKHSVNP